MKLKLPSLVAKFGSAASKRLLFDKNAAVKSASRFFLEMLKNMQTDDSQKA